MRHSLFYHLSLDLDVVGRLLELEVPLALGDLGVVQQPECDLKM